MVRGKPAFREPFRQCPGQWALLPLLQGLLVGAEGTQGGESCLGSFGSSTLPGVPGYGQG